MKYTQALRFLNSFANYEERNFYKYKNSFNLKRVTNLLSLLGNPHKHIKSVLIGGTNGKGSTAAILHGLLNSQSYRVGLYTSPHLLDITERIRIGSKRITKACFSRHIEQINACLRKGWDVKRHGGSLTYFEVLTVVAILYFFHENVDCALFEVGLGGRLDATNVLNPLFSIITSIGYDHEHILGSSLIKITREKAGIIKRNSVVISAWQRPEVRRVLRKTAIARGTKIFYYKRDFGVSSVHYTSKGMKFRYKNFKDLFLPLRGHFQAENTALALRAFELLGEHFSFKKSNFKIKCGLKKVSWPGRFEVISNNPSTVVDGAHNPDAMRAVVLSVREIFPGKDVIVIFAVSGDKNIDKLLRELHKLNPFIIITQTQHERSCDARRLKSKAVRYFPGAVGMNSVKEAYKYALNISTPNSLIVCTGSLFLVGEIKKIFKC